MRITSESGRTLTLGRIAAKCSVCGRTNRQTLLVQLNGRWSCWRPWHIRKANRDG